MRRIVVPCASMLAALFTAVALSGCTTTKTASDGQPVAAAETVSPSKPKLADHSRQTVTVADRYKEAQAYQKAEKHADAFLIFQKLAAEGHAPSAYDYARALDQGDGVPRDEAEAKKWYGKAADLGSPRAHYLAGLTYANGAGVEQHFDEQVE